MGFLAMAIGIVLMAFGIYACNDPDMTASRKRASELPLGWVAPRSRSFFRVD